jgi:hypothetical protein
MKKVFWRVKGVFMKGVIIYTKVIMTLCIGLVFMTCETGTGGDKTGTGDDHEKNQLRTLKISNQSGVYIWDIRWNSLDFSMAGPIPADMVPWPDNYYGLGLSQGTSSTQVVQGNSLESSYVFFKVTIGGKSGTTFSFRTQELVLVDVDDGPEVEFKILSNTIVVDTSGAGSTQGPLSGFLSGS